LGGKINQKELIMQNEPNFSKSQIFITLIITTNYNKKWTLDTWSKQTQTKPISQMPKIVVTAVYTMTNNYEQRTTNHPKQTQTKPILSGLISSDNSGISLYWVIFT
jgi:hypothetical protein